MENLTGAKVYVVNFAGHDTSQAKNYGDLINITEGKVNVFSTDRLVAELRIKLKKFNHEKDYLLISGTILLNILVLRVLWKVKAKPVNILAYNFISKAYIVRTI